MNRGGRLLIVVLGAAAAVGLFVVLRDDNGDEATATTPTSRTLTAQQPPPAPPPLEILVPTNTEAVTRRTVPRGARVVLVVSGAPGEEVHLHGYDVLRRIGPQGVVRLPFRATVPGRFELELEASHRRVADLTVR